MEVGIGFRTNRSLSRGVGWPAQALTVHGPDSGAAAVFLARSRHRRPVRSDMR